MAFVLGVDGGGSKTLAVLGDEAGTVWGVGRGGDANHQGQGVAAAMAQVRLAVQAALDMAGVEATAVDVAHYGLAGADLPEDFEVLRPALDRLQLARRFGFDNDITAVLRSGTKAPNAVVVGWGSGTNALGRNEVGTTIRLPALGWMSGDWGGGWDLSREAISLVARAHDGRGEPTELAQPILEALGVWHADEMIRKLYFGDKQSPEILHIAPIVFHVAAAGDAVACALVRRAGTEVATTAYALLRRLQLLRTPTDVVLGGSILRADGELLMDTICAWLGNRAPAARIIVPDIEPVLGAYFEALDIFGSTVDSHVRVRATNSYDRLANPRL